MKKSMGEKTAFPGQTITPGQALLILIDHYRDDPIKSDELKRLYLSGANSEKSRQKMDAVLHDNLLDGYRISFDPIIINADPTRRYFETHLSYETVAKELSSVSKEELENHLREIKRMIPPEKMQLVEHILAGEFREGDNLLYKEYADYLSKIKTDHIFQALSVEEKEKVALIVKISFLGVYNAQINPLALPLNIYGTGIYSDAAKGKIIDPSQSGTRNQQLGLMKGYMPLALDDIALSSVEIPYLKPSDQSRFNPNAEWIKRNFDTYVHPFSNSISGTMLCQLRNMAEFDRMKRNHNPSYMNVFTQSQEKTRSFTKLMISTMLYGSGGHSLNEYVAPLSLPVVLQEFSHVLHDVLTLEALYYPRQGSAYTQSSNAFDTVIEKAIQYNNHYMRKRALNAQIKGVVPVHSTEFGSRSSEYLRKSQLTKEEEELRDIVTSPDYAHLTKMIPQFEEVKRLAQSNELILAKQKLDDIRKTLPNRQSMPPQVVQQSLAFANSLNMRIESILSKTKTVSHYKRQLTTARAEVDESTKDKAPRNTRDS